MERSQFVENFVDNGEGEEDITKSNKKKRTRSKSRNWIIIKEFEGASEAETYVKNEGNWSKSSTKRNNEGERVEFRCNKGQYRDNECPAAIYLMYHSADTKVSLYSTNSEHIHNNNLKRTQGMTDDCKEMVTNLFKIGVDKPNAIIVAFRDQNLVEPCKTQLNNFLRTLRRQMHGPPIISSNELREWCSKRSTIPDDMDNLFVMDYIIKCDSANSENQELKIVMSTKRLLGNLEKSSMIQVDATYKVIWQGYPLIVIGSSDKNRVFHPLAISVCPCEIANDFSFIFSALHKFNMTWKPSVLLADESAAITNGFTNIFGKPETRLICYLHVLQSIEKRLKSIKVSDLIKNDISLLQLCGRNDIFIKASKLFLEKWYLKNNPNINAFLKYFNDEWLKKNENWYEGAALSYPSTNEGIESTNAIIKKEHGIRERLPVAQFLNKLDSLLLKWSRDRNPTSPDYKEFCLKETISLSVLNEAYQWAQLNKTIMQVSNTFYACSSTLETNCITQQIVNKYIEKDWKTFDEFKERYFSVWAIESDTFACSCPSYMKNYKCKHSLGLQIRLGKLTAPQ